MRILLSLAIFFGGVAFIVRSDYLCTMRTFFTLIILLLTMGVSAVKAQKHTLSPLYIVNGERMSEEQVRAIHPADIVDNQLLPIDEQVIERYGIEASNGVVLITLRYDTPARFEVNGEEQNYSSYIAERVKWSEMDGVARVVLSFTLGQDGSIVTTDVLEATDKRLLRRIEKAMAEAPRWIPAQKDGKGISTEHLLRITLPKGRKVPQERVWRIG